jgi:hypothetical protein
MQLINSLPTTLFLSSSIPFLILITHIPEQAEQIYFRKDESVSTNASCAMIPSCLPAEV